MKIISRTPLIAVVVISVGLLYWHFGRRNATFPDPGTVVQSPVITSPDVTDQKQRLKFKRRGIPRPVAAPSEQNVLSLESKVESILQDIYGLVLEQEAQTATLLANYTVKNIEVAAVQFTALSSDELIPLYHLLEQRLLDTLPAEEVTPARQLAAEKLRQFATFELPNQGLTVFCPIDGSGKVRYSLVQSADPNPLSIEDGRVIESISNGRFRELNEEEAQRYSHILSTESVE